MGTIPKTEGATMTCVECSTELECHMSTYSGSYQNKLQWQNPDGSAHYKWIGTDKDGNAKFKCVLPETKPPETKPTQQELDSKSKTPPGYHDEDGHLVKDNSKPTNEKHLQERQDEIKNLPPVPKLDDDKASKVIQETELLNSIEELVMATLKKYEIAPSPQKAGMFTRIIYNTYFSPKFEKASKI